MPTTNKRINLTVPEHIYNRLENYKAKNGITSDAAACLQLIVRQLDGIENTERMMEMAMRFKPEELERLSSIGLETIKALKENNAG
jgi:hypothetical protein